jgi:hypothetical protein
MAIQLVVCKIMLVTGLMNVLRTVIKTVSLTVDAV